jgi:hypothetical protein
MDEAVRMLLRVIELNRHAVRRRFEQRFSSVLMAKDYVALEAVHIGARDDRAAATTGIGKKVEWTGS